MNTLQEAFFFFLRKGLWGEVDDEPCTLPALSRGDWEELYRMACSQAVTGLLIDGVDTNIEEQLSIIGDPRFTSGHYDTDFMETR